MEAKITLHRNTRPSTWAISAIAARLIKNVLPDIIHCDQTGYVKDRFIGETIRLFYDIMEFTAEENIPGLLVFIDFKKAFDSVEYSFLYQCLEKFNFGPDFIRWVKTFYKNIQSCTINNGMASNFFSLERGVRQGDPLSPYLFIVAVETLAIAIRQNPSIKGISIGKEETKLLQYADDTTAVLSDTNSAKILFDLLNSFEYISGLQINYTKTEDMWILDHPRTTMTSHLASNGLTNPLKRHVLKPRRCRRWILDDRRWSMDDRRWTICLFYFQIILRLKFVTQSRANKINKDDGQTGYKFVTQSLGI